MPAENTIEDEYFAAFDEAAQEGEKGQEEAVVEEPEAVVDEAVEETQSEVVEEVEEDPLTGMSEEHRALFDDLQNKNKTLTHQYSSTNGRVSALQKKLNELTSRESAPAPTDPAEEETPPELAALKEEYPEIAGGIDALFDKRARTLKAEMDATKKALDEKLNPIQQQIARSEEERESASLLAAHPDIAEVVNSPEWSDWLANQPQAVIEMAESDVASEASYVLTSFKNAQAPQDRVPVIAKQKQRRDKQLEQATGIPTKSQSAASGEIPKDDYYAAFDAFE